MPTPTYVSPFTGTQVTQTDVTYEAFNLTNDIQLYWPATVPEGDRSLSRIMDVNASVTSKSITLPQADQGTTGIDSLIRNTGSFSMTVFNYDASQSFSISPGQAYYFYLTDNTTEGGSWSTVLFGAGTSVADASALAGTNLFVRSSLLSVGFPIVELLSVPLISQSNTGNVYVWQSGTGTIQLPAAANLEIGWFIGFRNNGTGSLYFQAQGTSIINSTSTLTVNPGESGFIVFNKSTNDFYTVGLTAPNIVTFTSSVYDVDNIVGSTFSLASYAPVIQTYVALSGTRTTNLTIEVPPISQLYTFINDTGAATYDLVFEVAGSMAAGITVAAGAVVLAVCDGSSLTILSQTTISGYFLANDGTSSVPTFSFSNDTGTGLYLKNIGQLGISANGQEIIDVDNTIPGSAVVTFDAEIKANLIDGGTF